MMTFGVGPCLFILPWPSTAAKCLMVHSIVSIGVVFVKYKINKMNIHGIFSVRYAIKASAKLYFFIIYITCVISYVSD